MLHTLKPTLHGRVFSRLHQFHALPQELKDEVARLEAHITTIQAEVFGKHHTLQLKSLRGVRYKQLLDTVYDWVKQQEVAAVHNAIPIIVSNEGVAQTPSEPAPLAEAESTPLGTHATHTSGVEAAPGIPVATTVPIAPAITEEVPAQSEAEADARRAAEESTKTARLTHTKRLIDALVLKGFITPNKEDKSAIPMTTEEFDFKDSELLVPLATAITGLIIPTTTVWDLVDGAVFAEMLKRKAGLLAPLTQGKDVYVVVNARAQTVTLFESDVAREPLLIYEAALTKVTFDKSKYEYGIKLWDETSTELLNTASVAERDALAKALEATGVRYQEDAPLPVHHAKRTNAPTSHTFTVEELTTAVSDAVPLGNTAEAFKTTVPSGIHANGMEGTTTTHGEINNVEQHHGETDKTTRPAKQFKVPEQSETSPSQPIKPAFETKLKPRQESNKAEKLTTHQTPSKTKRESGAQENKAPPMETAKHDETLATSPTETDAADLFGVGFTPESPNRKHEEEAPEKVLCGDDTQPMGTVEDSPPKATYFGLWTTSNANTNTADPNITNANKTNDVNNANKTNVNNAP
jgi:hypothetical protein